MEGDTATLLAGAINPDRSRAAASGLDADPPRGDFPTPHVPSPVTRGSLTPSGVDDPCTPTLTYSLSDRRSGRVVTLYLSPLHQVRRVTTASGSTPGLSIVSPVEHRSHPRGTRYGPRQPRPCVCAVPLGPRVTGPKPQDNETYRPKRC